MHMHDDHALTGTAAGRSPLFSVITATLNSGQDLVATVDSVDCQTFRSFEHIVKDAGTEDSKLVAHRANDRLRLVTQPDGGVYEGMNQAVQLCSGRYVVFLNAGDRFAGPDVLQLMAAAIKAAPEVDLAYCDLRHQEWAVTIRHPHQVTGFFLYRNTINHQCWFVKRDLFGRIGLFDVSFRISADWEWLLRALRTQVTFRHVPIVGIAYRGGGISRAPPNRARLAREIDSIRLRHNTPAQRLVYSIAWRATLPGLRSAMYEARIWRRAYSACVNAFYRLGGRR